MKVYSGIYRVASSLRISTDEPVTLWPPPRKAKEPYCKITGLREFTYFFDCISKSRFF